MWELPALLMCYVCVCDCLLVESYCTTTRVLRVQTLSITFVFTVSRNLSRQADKAFQQPIKIVSVVTIGTFGLF